MNYFGCVKSQLYVPTCIFCFCLGTEVPRHSAGCVGTWYVVRTYVDYICTSLFAMRPRNLLNRSQKVIMGFAWLLMNPLTKTVAM